MKRALSWLFAVLLWVILPTGCQAGAAMNEYVDADAGFRVCYPANWDAFGIQQADENRQQALPPNGHGRNDGADTAAETGDELSGGLLVSDGVAGVLAQAMPFPIPNASAEMLLAFAPLIASSLEMVLGAFEPADAGTVYQTEAYSFARLSGTCLFEGERQRAELFLTCRHEWLYLVAMALPEETADVYDDVFMEILDSFSLIES